MKKLTYVMSVLLLGSFATAVSATPIALQDSASFAINAINSSNLKMIAGSTHVFDNTSASDLDLMATRQSPGFSTQGMSSPMADISGTALMGMGSQTVNAASGAVSAAGPANNNVLVVPEPPMLVLFGLGLLLAAIRIRRTA